MRLSLRLFTALPAAAVMLMSFSCGEGQDSASAPDGNDEVSITVVSDPEIHGWIEMALADEPPLMAEADESTAWLLFEGGNLLQYSIEDGRWESYCLEGIDDVIDLDVSTGIPVLLTGGECYVFSGADQEAAFQPLPEAFTPVDLAVYDGEIAVLGSRGELAIREEEGEFALHSGDDNQVPAGCLTRIGPDWIYLIEGGGLAMYDPSVDLWQFEESPRGQVLASSSNILFIGSGDSVFVRTSPGEWDFHAAGELYDDGLLLTDAGISTVLSPGEILAERPAFQPSDLFSMERFREPFWAADQMGLAVYSELGSVETNLPFYETQRVSCSMAGQGSGGMQGNAGSIDDIMQGGTFRIYESVSIRPDPFTEFTSEDMDVRRDLATIAVEEFRLVGITLDPVGGDQAMVEDGLSVPYILYEGTELANNSRVAEITSNEVIVIQDVIIDYSARGGGETTIPTIYSLRLHEEGGL